MKYALAIAAIAAFSAPAFAQVTEFATVDADASGTVTWEEVQTAMPDVTEDAYKAADADSSGDLSAEEFATITAG